MKTFSRRNLVSGKVEGRDKHKGEGIVADDHWYDMICDDGMFYPVFEDEEGFIEVGWNCPLSECVCDDDDGDSTE